MTFPLPNRDPKVARRAVPGALAVLRQRWLRAALLALGTGLLASCALLGSKPVKPPPETVAAAPPAEPPAPKFPAPVDTHTFVLSANDNVVGAVQLTTVSKDDTLPDIARRFNVGYDEMVRANPGVDPWLPGAGRVVVVPTRFVLPDAPREGIVINVAALRLFYYPPHKKGEPQVVYTHPIGIGKVGWSTPEGVTKIVTHKKDPIWRPSAALRKDHMEDSGEELPTVVMPGPDNPLGHYEMTLGWPSFLIHGTNKPYGVGLRSSHGCVRLYPEDIEKIFAMVKDGTPVRVVNQPNLLGWQDGQVYLQAYDVLQDDQRDWAHAQKKLLTHELTPQTQKDLKTSGTHIDWDAVAQATHAPRGVPIPISGDAGSIDSVLAAAPTVENRIPDGANWDGVDETGDDSKNAQQILSDREPNAAQAHSADRPGG